MVIPTYLKKGDRIGIIAPARSISPDLLQPSIRSFQRWGLEVVTGKNIFNQHHQFAGTDEERLADLQQMLNDDSIRAVICARGGYGILRIIDRIDFTNFIRHPKWIVGYSDITVLHSHIQENFGIETIHATMPVNITDENDDHRSIGSLKKVLFGEKIFYSQRITFLSRTGLSDGILTGGNLSLIYSMMGSRSSSDTGGKILFLEDVDEYLYHIDRMMMGLKRAGLLAGLNGLIVGGMDRMRDNDIPFGKSANEIIAEAVAEYNYPVWFDFPAGHGEKNVALILGRKVSMSVEEKMELFFK